MPRHAARRQVPHRPRGPRSSWKKPRARSLRRTPGNPRRAEPPAPQRETMRVPTLSKGHPQGLTATHDYTRRPEALTRTSLRAPHRHKRRGKTRGREIKQKAPMIMRSCLCRAFTMKPVLRQTLDLSLHGGGHGLPIEAEAESHGVLSPSVNLRRASDTERRSRPLPPRSAHPCRRRSRSSPLRSGSSGRSREFLPSRARSPAKRHHRRSGRSR